MTIRTSQLLLLLSLGLYTLPGNTAINRFELITPRAFGYVIGDVITHRVEFELADPYQLVQDSLPRAGRVNQWLELRPGVFEASKQPNATAYAITLNYQILNAPEALKEIFTPAHTLMFTDGERSFPVFISQWVFSVAPLTSKATSGVFDLQPEQEPLPMPLTPHIRRLGLSLVGIAAALGLLAYIYGTIPFLRRTQEPFARAYRKIRQYQRKPGDALIYREALRCTHRAFNETAGKVVFAEALDEFFIAHPRFLSLRGPIQEVFTDSRSVFFNPSTSMSAQRISLDKLLQLVRGCRDIERGLV